MAETVIPYGSPQAVQVQSAGLFAANMQRPDGFVLRDGELELNALPDRDYELFLEGYCLPAAMRDDADVPEIDAVHHARLLNWVMFRAFSVPDKEVFDPAGAAGHEMRFEHYFGRKPQAALRRPQSANHPHHNQCWW